MPASEESGASGISGTLPESSDRTMRKTARRQAKREVTNSKRRDLRTLMSAIRGGDNTLKV
jgi:hypothetical protein